MKLTRKGQVVTGVTVAGAVGLLSFFVNPDWLPACFFHSLTGWNCPGCGSTRALHQLTNGNFLTALQFNPLTILALPVIGLWLVRRDHAAPKPLWIWLTLGVVLAFGIARNLPIYPFTLVNP